MLDILLEARRQLPTLLLEEDKWKDIDVDYHPPRVKRVWRQWGENRIFLHEIDPCSIEEALLHPHAWKSGMFLGEGSYMMLTGKSPTNDPPAIVERTLLAAGSSYEMIDPDSWHAVAPITVCQTMMVTSPPTGRSAPKSTKELQKLTPETRARIIEFWRNMRFDG